MDFLLVYYGINPVLLWGTMQIVYAFSRKHVKANLWATFLLSAFCIVAFSCSNELHMLLPEGPEGPEGPAGKSAYEVWVDEVNKGLENPHNPGNNWPKDQTELNDFCTTLPVPMARTA